MTERLGPYLLGPNDTPENGIYTGDALEWLRLLPKQSIDAVVTDPPYFLPARHYATRKVFPRRLGDLRILEHFFTDFFDETRRVLKSTGIVYIFCDGQSYPVFYACVYPLARRVVPLIWDKVVAFSGYSWRHQHEIILMAEMDNYPAVRTGDGDILKARAVPVDERIHPAQKPLTLVMRLIEKSVQPGAIVVDPFCGSGTVLAAAKALGVCYLGCDIEAQYVEIARERVRTTQMPLFVLEPDQKEMMLNIPGETTI